MIYDPVREVLFEKSAKELLLEMNPNARKKLIVAIEDLFSMDGNITWEFVDTALKKKSIEN